MNILDICKPVSRGCKAIATIILLLASFTNLYALEKDKNKKGDSSPAKSDSAQKSAAHAEKHKTTSPQTEGANKRSRSGGDHSNYKSGGTSSTVGTGSAVNSDGHKHHKTGDAATSSTAGAGSSVNSDGGHKHHKSSDAATTTTGGTGATGATSATSTTGKTGKHSSNASGTNTTTSTGVSNGTDNSAGTNKTRKAERASEAAASSNKTTIVSPGITRGSNGKVEVYRGHNGSEARFRRDGAIREVHLRDMTIVHGPSGSRRVVVERIDHSRVVAYRGGYGYVQRPFIYRGNEFATRTYLYRGRPYAAYYQRYPYRGVYLEGYRPYRYYRPAFYGWAYDPWRSPVRYSWGWAGNPWYGYYGGYFRPYPTYSSASFWLTDFFLAASLQSAYQQRSDDRAYFASQSNDSVVLTPEIKQAIATEVQSQLALENSESQRAAQGGDVDLNASGLPRILAEASPSHPRVFVVAGPIDVTDERGQECGLTAGDVLRLSSAPPSDATSIYLQVFASKNQECPRGTTVSVGLVDLQEMQNNMRASIDQGLQELQSHQGGLPAPPPLAAAPPMQASFAPAAPQADPNVSNELQQQAQEADAAEKGVLDELKQEDNSAGGVQDTNGSSNSPVQISLGQTTAEVIAALGNPKQIVNLGAKRIYVYSKLKITFTDGKVTNVE